MLCDSWVALACVDVPLSLSHTDGQMEGCQLSAVTKNALMNTFVCVPLCTSMLFCLDVFLKKDYWIRELVHF